MQYEELPAQQVQQQLAKKRKKKLVKSQLLKSHNLGVVTLIVKSSNI